MQTKKNITKISIFSSLAVLFYATAAKAMCPICTIAAGTGVVIFRNMGIDDSITGTWIGGLLMSTSMWTVNWLDKKNIKFWGKNFLVGAIYYATVLIPFYQKNMISKSIFGAHYQTLFGVDKLVLGIALGSIFFVVGASAYNVIKKNNGGHAHFPFEKVVLPISPLLILTIIFYFLTRS